MAQIKFDITAIIPLKFKPLEIGQAIPKALEQAALEMMQDFQSTAATWDHKPTFNLTTRPDSVVISTDDENWIRVSRGVPAKGKVLARRRPSGKRFFRIEKRRSKTKPGRLKASAGGKTGEVVYRASYQHKGITPRHFTRQIARKYMTRYPQIMIEAHQRGIRAGVSSRAKEVRPVV